MIASPLQIIIVLIIIILLFGPKRIAGIGSALGESIKGFKKGLSDEDSHTDKTQTSERLSKVSKSSESQDH